jgi:hypothetical protein
LILNIRRMSIAQGESSMYRDHASVVTADSEAAAAAGGKEG